MIRCVEFTLIGSNIFMYMQYSIHTNGNDTRLWAKIIFVFYDITGLMQSTLYWCLPDTSDTRWLFIISMHVHCSYADCGYIVSTSKYIHILHCNGLECLFDKCHITHWLECNRDVCKINSVVDWMRVADMCVFSINQHVFVSINECMD